MSKNRGFHFVYCILKVCFTIGEYSKNKSIELKTLVHGVYNISHKEGAITDLIAFFKERWPFLGIVLVLPYLYLSAHQSCKYFIKSVKILYKMVSSVSRPLQRLRTGENRKELKVSSMWKNKEDKRNKNKPNEMRWTPCWINQLKPHRYLRLLHCNIDMFGLTLTSCRKIRNESYLY